MSTSKEREVDEGEMVELLTQVIRQSANNCSVTGAQLFKQLRQDGRLNVESLAQSNIAGVSSLLGTLYQQMDEQNHPDGCPCDGCDCPD